MAYKEYSFKGVVMEIEKPVEVRIYPGKWRIGIRIDVSEPNVGPQKMGFLDLKAEVDKITGGIKKGEYVGGVYLLKDNYLNLRSLKPIPVEPKVVSGDRPKPGVVDAMEQKATVEKPPESPPPLEIIKEKGVILELSERDLFLVLAGEKIERKGTAGDFSTKMMFIPIHLKKSIREGEVK